LCCKPLLKNAVHCWSWVQISVLLEFSFKSKAVLADLLACFPLSSQWVFFLTVHFLLEPKVQSLVQLPLITIPTKLHVSFPSLPHRPPPPFDKMSLCSPGWPWTCSVLFHSVSKTSLGV
jgi:hypothetical protein